LARQMSPLLCYRKDGVFGGLVQGLLLLADQHGIWLSATKVKALEPFSKNQPFLRRSLLATTID